MTGMRPVARGTDKLNYRLQNNEIVIDLFAGAGEGAEAVSMMLGTSPAISVNHCPDALGAHAVNHPDTIHFVSDIFAAQPNKTVKRIALGIERFVIETDSPYIVNKNAKPSASIPLGDIYSPVIFPVTHHGAGRYYGMTEQLPTITCANRGELALLKAVSQSAQIQSPPISLHTSEASHEFSTIAFTPACFQNAPRNGAYIQPPTCNERRLAA